MAEKNYVIFNFTDYGQGKDADTRTTPTNLLTGAFERRVVDKGGSIRIHHMADLLAELRVARHGKRAAHEAEGLLDEGWIRCLTVEAATYRSLAWGAIKSSCLEADKIVFAAHGHVDDTDNVYTDVGLKSVRCGGVDGIVWFLNSILGYMQRSDPTVTLVVCYAARSAEHQKDHAQNLNVEDIRSSLAFKIFCGLSENRPQVRLTARTGAVAAASHGTTLTTQTEEAIMAAEKLGRISNEDAQRVVNDALEALRAFEAAVDASTTLTAEEKKLLQNRVTGWLEEGYNPKTLDEIIEQIDRMEWDHRSAAVKFFSKIGKAVDPAWSETHAAEVQQLRLIGRMRNYLHNLHELRQQKLSKYGKFVYQRKGSTVYVSGWNDNSLVQVTALP